MCDLSLRFGEDEEDGNGGGGMVCVWLIVEGGDVRRKLFPGSMCAAASGGAEQTEAPLPLFTLPFPHPVQSRPFGVALLIAGWDPDHGPML